MTRHAVLPSLALTLVLAGCSSGGGSDPPTQPPPGGGNHNPTANLNLDKTHLAYNETAKLSVIAADPDDDQVTFEWSAVRGTVTASGPTATTATFKAGTSWGPASATVTASDGAGGSAQATATAYVRNPNPPQFSFFPVGTATCGYGTANPEGFALRITAAESVLVTSITVRPRDCSIDYCGRERTYATPFRFAPGQEFVWDGGCLTTTCCVSRDCGNCQYWTIEIEGRRPEPDGGTFTFTCSSWNPSYPSNSCN